MVTDPEPALRVQKGTSTLVELGNGTLQPRRFFFDLGNGSVGHALALQIPAPLINDIFISHLHADHFADLPYMYPFRAFIPTAELDELFQSAPESEHA